MRNVPAAVPWYCRIFRLWHLRQTNRKHMKMKTLDFDIASILGVFTTYQVTKYNTYWTCRSFHWDRCKTISIPLLMDSYPKQISCSSLSCVIGFCPFTVNSSFTASISLRFRQKSLNLRVLEMDMEMTDQQKEVCVKPLYCSRRGCMFPGSA